MNEKSKITYLTQEEDRMLFWFTVRGVKDRIRQIEAENTPTDQIENYNQLIETCKAILKEVREELIKRDLLASKDFRHDVKDEGCCITTFDDEINIKGYKATLSGLVKACQNAIILVKEKKAKLEDKSESARPKADDEMRDSSNEKITNISKIRWIGKNYKLLIALFDLLYEAKLIDEKSFKQTAAHMAHHFSNAGSEISADGVRQCRNTDYQDERIQLIDELFQLFHDATDIITS